MEVLHLNKASYEKLISQTQKAVLIDFGATWCGPCQMLAPELEKLAAAHPDLIVGKIDVDEERDLAVSLGIDSVPALFFYRSGTLEKKLVGFLPKAELEEHLSL